MGIHHITAIVGNPQENVDFYAGVLGLRLVKKTVNFDDPGTYHLYFSDNGGNPGTVITFFPRSGAQPGKIGSGQVGISSFAVPRGSLVFWKERLKEFNVTYVLKERFSEQYIAFDDPHGLQLEIVEREAGENNQWSFGGITPNVAIKGIAGVTLFSNKPESTAILLEDIMGFERVGEEEGLVRFKSIGDIGNIIDLKRTPMAGGTTGVGTVHHVALRAIDDEDQFAWKSHVESYGYHVTSEQDRNYFKAIYFKEKGGVLFEIATDPPGFAHDESHQTMGKNLMLPERYESQREKLEKLLEPIEVRELK